MQKRKISFIVILIVVIIPAIWWFTMQDREPVNRLGSITNIEQTLGLDPEAHTLSAELSLRWTGAQMDTFDFLLHRDLTIGSVMVDGATAGELRLAAEGAAMLPRLHQYDGDSRDSADVAHLALYRLPVSGRTDTVTVRLSYEGPIHDDVSVAGFSRWEIADETSGIIDPRGAFLAPGTGYYPLQPGEGSLTHFRTTLGLPDAWKGLVEGNVSRDEAGRPVFDSVHPLDGCHLVAGPYFVRSVETDGVEVAMYYYEGTDKPEGPPPGMPPHLRKGGGDDLVTRYLEASSDYIRMYNDLIGPYAFDRFSVVENWFPTGYGMPTYTLLGSQVIRLPFIISTSLGHEVAHNWWGNGVLVDYETGNWCEGLTTYSADYRYKLNESPAAAREYRRDVLRDYSEYVVRGDEEGFPLREFTSRTTAGSRTIGYGKSMMVFHMMQLRLGSETFWAALRDMYSSYLFDRASWSDFFRTFGRKNNEVFDWYEKQWIDRAGAPSLELANVIFLGSQRDRHVEFDIRQVQQGLDYWLDVPVRLVFKDGAVQDTILRDVRGKLYHARVPVKSKPVSVSVDPDFDLFRVLAPEEAPATLAGFYAAEDPVVLIHPDNPMVEAYESFARDFFRRTEKAQVVVARQVPDSLAGRSVLHLGVFDETKRALEQMDLNRRQANVAVAAFRDPEQPGRVHAEIWSASLEALEAAASKLPHYGKYSYLAFSSARNIGKGQWEVTSSPLTVELPVETGKTPGN